MRQRSFEAADGSRRTVLELDADEVGPSLRYATFPRDPRQRYRNPDRRCR